MTRVCSTLWLLLAVSACAEPPARPNAYAVRTTFALTAERDGLTGQIALLEDARVRPAMRDAIREAYGDDPCGGDDPPAVLRELCAERRPPRPALLRVVDATGREVFSETQERPLAELSTVHLYGDSVLTYLLTVDLSAGFGSYSGPATRLAEVRGGRLAWVTASDTEARRSETILLASTLKTEWRLVPRADAKGSDILQIRCRPDLDASLPADSARFILTFERYTFDGGRWARHSREEPGFWENEGEETFPSRARFP